MILLTGATGFVGRHASALLPCVPLAYQGSVVDLRESASLRSALGALEFDSVLHLAGQSFVPDSFQDPIATFDVNFLGTARLLTALKDKGFRGRMLYVSSGDVYAQVPASDLPIREDMPTRPRSPYAVSKVAAEALCYQWSQTAAFEIVVARPFNHIGPGQSARFAIADFARQIVRIRRGQREPRLVAGDLEVTRDFTDVRDVVKAYEALLDKGRNGEIYNVCSGHERTLSALVQRLLQIAGVQAEIVVDRDRLRPSEQRRACGSLEKIATETGWQPEVSIDKSLEDLITYWEQEETL